MSAEEIKEFTDQVVARPGCVVADVHRANLIHGIWKTKFSNLENERFHKLLSDELEKPAIRNFFRKFRKKRFFLCHSLRFSMSSINPSSSSRSRFLGAEKN